MTDIAALSPQRILVCQLRQLGDVILTTPALELLRRRFPAAELHLFTESKCVPLLENNPHVDKVWGLDKKKLTPFPKEIAWYWHVARTGYDLVVDFQQLPRCRWVVAFSGASVRLAATPPWYTRLLYTHSAPVPEGYAAASKAAILAPLGICWNGERPRLYLTSAERIEAQGLLAATGLLPGQTLVTLDPTHRQTTRRWPVRHYVELVRGLCAARPDVRILPLWGPGEEPEIRELVAQLPEGCCVMPQAMLSLRQMAACIAEAKLHIGNCSAPRHMAVAVDTPSLTVLGSTSHGWTYPSGACGGPTHSSLAAELPCQPCDRNTCSNRRCLEEFDASRVLPVALKMLLE